MFDHTAQPAVCNVSWSIGEMQHNHPLTTAAAAAVTAARCADSARGFQASGGYVHIEEYTIRCSHAECGLARIATANDCKLHRMVAGRCTQNLINSKFKREIANKDRKSVV